MSKHYAIRTELVDQFDRRNIVKILNNGKSLGCIYFPDVWPHKTRITPLKIDAAATIIEKNIVSQDELPCILSQLQDSLFYIFFRKAEDDNLIITLSPLASIWKLSDDNDISRIDFPRYIKVLLALIDGLLVKHLETIEE